MARSVAGGRGRLELSALRAGVAAARRAERVVVRRAKATTSAAAAWCGDRRGPPGRGDRRLRCAPAADSGGRDRPGCRGPRGVGHHGRRALVRGRRCGRNRRWPRSIRTPGWSCAGPSPGGLRSVDVARIVGLPLLASMRAGTGSGRTPRERRVRCDVVRRLPGAARKVLAVLAQHPQVGARHERLVDRSGARATGRGVRAAAAERRRRRDPCRIRRSARRHRSADQPADAADGTDRRGNPGATPARGGHHRRAGDCAGRGMGGRRKRFAAQLDSVR